MTPAAWCGILGCTTFTDAIALEALERVVPATLLRGAALAADVPTERRRKLPAEGLGSFAFVKRD